MYKIIKQPKISDEIFNIEYYLDKREKIISHSIVDDVISLKQLNEKIAKNASLILKNIKGEFEEIKLQINIFQKEKELLENKILSLKKEIAEQETKRKNIVDEILKQKETLSQINSEIKEIQKNAYTVGFNKGKEDGLHSGKTEALEKLSAIFQSIDKTSKFLHQITQNALQEKENFLKKNEEDILNLSLTIAKKILQEEITVNKQVIFSILKSAIDKAIDKNKMVIRVNPNDLETINSQKEEIMRLKKAVGEMKFLADENIEQGGCIIETDAGIIDAKISSQIEEIEKNIL